MSTLITTVHILAVAAYLCFLHALPALPPAARCALLRRLDRVHTCAPLVEPSHVADCRLSRTLRFPSSRARVFDRFVVAHLAGWAVKAALYPARGPLWAASLLFELVERAAVGALPELAECWWDSLLLDVALCNAAGIEAGLLLARCARRVHPGAAAGVRVFVVVARIVF